MAWRRQVAAEEHATEQLLVVSPDLCMAVRRRWFLLGMLCVVGTQAQAYELFLTSDCSIETAESIEKKMDNVTFMRPGALAEGGLPSSFAARQHAHVDDSQWYCVYEFDMDSQTFLPLRACFAVDRLPSLPPSLRSPGV